MSKRPWTARPWNLGLIGVLGLLSVADISAWAHAPTASPAPSQEKQPAATALATNTSATPKTPREKAWGNPACFSRRILWNERTISSFRNRFQRRGSYHPVLVRGCCYQTFMDDDKDLVRYMAAACIAHLSDLPLKKVSAKTRKP